MSGFTESEIQDILKFLTEGLAEAGFTGTKFERAVMPLASWEILTRESRTGKTAEPMPEEFSDEIIYHRVTTDQGKFGLWLEPFITLDLGGTGVAQAFLPSEVGANPGLGDWCFIGLEEATFMKLFIEFIKKSRQP